MRSCRALEKTEWFQTQHTQGINAFVGPRFDQYSLIIKSAVLGFGVGLVPRFLIEDELERGQLVSLFDGPCAARQGYYLCTPLSHTPLAKMQRFRAWLLAVAKVAGPCSTESTVSTEAGAPE